MRRLIILALCSTLAAFGWGPEGHHLVARLATERLTPAAAARVAQILGPETSMQSVSVWPDQIRRDRQETGPWHYIDIPIDKPHLEMARDCPKGDCVIAKIEEFRRVVADPAVTDTQRKEALMFLVHFVGDMHQPLHCANNNDRGGNDVKLDVFGRPSNLHGLWDVWLLERMGQEDALFPQFSAELTEERSRKWGQGTVEEWAEESHKAASDVVYGKLPKAPAGGRVTVDAEYERLAAPVIREQIEKAGARLAMLLNATLR